MKAYNYIPRNAKIIKKGNLSDDSVEFSVKMADKKSFNFSPGQFVMVSVFGFGEVPIGITTSPKEKGSFGIAVRAVGMVTKKLCGLSVGDIIGINGPFGNDFPITYLVGKDVVLIAGGIGMAPLRSLVRHIEKSPKLVKSLTVLYGAREEEQLLYRDEFKDWEKFAKLHLTVDKCGPDWEGCVGNITKLFDRADIKRGSVIIVCGPPVMYDAIIKRYAGKTVAEKDLYFLLERKMKCGIGKCQHCTCGQFYVCLDGPVFSYNKLKYNKEAFK